MAQLKFRGECGFNTYGRGGRFLVTDSENKSEQVTAFSITSDRVRYQYITVVILLLLYILFIAMILIIFYISNNNDRL